VDQKQPDDEGTSECYRDPSSNHVLTPGLLVVFCQHGICLGFQLLDSHESEAHVFQFFYERCEARMCCTPSVVVMSCCYFVAALLIFYDRACKLHIYCLIREPFFFRRSTFRVDMLHYANHVGCSEGYNPSIYRSARTHSSSASAPYVNSQVAEQGNSALATIKNAASFMTMEHALKYLRRFLGARNLRKMQAMDVVA
jgi:hypothetical protein